jgi:hypothetical protein
MRFPHLDGPLPMTAVVAVVPYRPPVLPDPDDALGRGLALNVSVPVRRAAEVRDVPGGVAVLEPRLRHSGDDNRLLLTSPVGAGTVERTASVVGAEAGWPHVAAALCWSGARSATTFADDWPRHWYARAGFEVVGSIWEAWRRVTPERGS